MISVLTGTSHFQFDRLLFIIDHIAKNSNEKFWVQKGHSKFVFNNCDSVSFCSRDFLIKQLSASSLIITQGGFGSMYDSIKSGKPVIAVPRKIEFGETSAEQDSLVDHYEKLGLLFKCNDVNSLFEYITLKSYLIHKGKYSGTDNIPHIKDILSNFL